MKDLFERLSEEENRKKEQELIEEYKAKRREGEKVERELNKKWEEEGWTWGDWDVIYDNDYKENYNCYNESLYEEKSVAHFVQPSYERYMGVLKRVYTHLFLLRDGTITTTGHNNIAIILNKETLALVLETFKYYEEYYPLELEYMRD